MAKKATRAAYGEALVELAERYPELVVLEADLSSATMTKAFGAKYPERFFNCGIAEANMVGIAAGMATCGLKPFANTFAIFAAGRAYEQVRNSVGYPHLNVTVVGSHGGISVGEDGATHQMLEDLTLMRVIPGMTVVNPCDANEMKLAVEALIRHRGPAYLRLGRAPVEEVTANLPGYRFTLGKGVTLREGTDLTLVATGLGVQLALEAAELLEQEGISPRVLDIHTIKPLDEELILQAARETGLLITVEEHSVKGGLGGAVAELLAEQCPTRVIPFGIYDEFGRSGTAADLLRHYGLTGRKLAEKAMTALGRAPQEREPERQYALTIRLEGAWGRHVVGWQEEDGLKTREIDRFPLTWTAEQPAWALEELLFHLREGIDAALALFPHIQSFSIDAPGGDYVLLRGDGEPQLCRPTGAGAGIGLPELYRRTGGTAASRPALASLCAQRDAGELEGVTDLMLLPEYLAYRLTGGRGRLATQAAALGLLQLETGDYDWTLIQRLHLPAALFTPLSPPGQAVGSYRGMVCLLTPSGDWSAAAERLPMAENAPYLLGGEETILGLRLKKPCLDLASELSGWTNTPEQGFLRYEKRLPGTAMLDALREALCPELDPETLAQAAEKSLWDGAIDLHSLPITDPEALRASLASQRRDPADLLHSAARALTSAVLAALRELQGNTGLTFERIVYADAPARARFLTALLAEATGKTLLLSPPEAAVEANLRAQLSALAP